MFTGLFYWTSFQPFFSCFPPPTTLPLTLPSSFILCMFSSTLSLTQFSLLHFWSCFEPLVPPWLKQEKWSSSRTWTINPWAVMDIGAADNGRSVPGMTSAHCGHLEVQIGQCNYESQFLQNYCKCLILWRRKGSVYYSICKEFIYIHTHQVFWLSLAVKLAL